MNFLGSHCGREYIAKNLPRAIFAVMTGVEEVGLENLEICTPINGCGCSLWWETTHTAAEAAHIWVASLTTFFLLDETTEGYGVVI